MYKASSSGRGKGPKPMSTKKFALEKRTSSSNNGLKVPPGSRGMTGPMHSHMGGKTTRY